MKNKYKSLTALVLSMLIFGTVGIFSKHIPLQPGAIAFVRATVGMLFLITVMAILRKKPNFASIRKNLPYLMISGICLGANWILFFAACRYTTVPTATLSYYLAPAILIIAAFFVFREKITVKKALAILVALFGMVLAAGVIEGGAEGVSYIGILFGLAAAVLYATVVIFNKLMSDIDAFDKTVVQFGVCGAVLLPYVLIFEGVNDIKVDFKTVIFALLVGIIHTGAAYALYFGVTSKLSSDTIAIYSYIDPVVSILVSTVFFKEPITLLGALGAVLIIGASLISEIDVKNVKSRKTDEEKQDENR